MKHKVNSIHTWKWGHEGTGTIGYRGHRGWQADYKDRI